MFGYSRLVVHSLVKRFEQTGMSIDAQDRRDFRKQSQENAVNLHSHIDLSGSSRQL